MVVIGKGPSGLSWENEPLCIISENTYIGIQLAWKKYSFIQKLAYEKDHII